jgi:hypothetical protein
MEDEVLEINYGKPKKEYGTNKPEEYYYPRYRNRFGIYSDGKTWEGPNGMAVVPAKPKVTEEDFYDPNVNWGDLYQEAHPEPKIDEAELARARLKKLEALKLEVMAQNPMITGVSTPNDYYERYMGGGYNAPQVSIDWHAKYLEQERTHAEEITRIRKSYEEAMEEGFQEAYQMLTKERQVMDTLMKESAEARKEIEELQKQLTKD